MKVVLKKKTEKIRPHLEEIYRIKQKCNAKIKKTFTRKRRKRDRRKYLKMGVLKE